MKTRCTIKVPARLHMSVWDMNKFGLGRRGGGGVGMALNEFTVLEGELWEEDFMSGDAKGLSTEYLKILKKKFGVEHVGFHINIVTAFCSHIGLGSSGSILMGMILLFAELLELSISDAAILELYASIICEEHNGELTKCYETLVGPWCSLVGGLVVVDKSCNLIGRYDIGEDFMILLVTPKQTAISNSFEAEKILLEGKGKAFDTLDEDLKKKIFNKMQEEHEYVRKAELVDLLKYLGSKRAEIQYQNKAYNNLFQKLIDIGNQNHIVLSGMSSVGPTFFYGDKKDKLKKLEYAVKDLDVQMKYTAVHGGSYIVC